MKVGALLREKMSRRCDSALLGAFLLVAGSVISKLSSFGLSVYLAKKIDPELFGVGFVSIALTTSLSQALNKKCFRRVALSEAPDPADKQAHLQSCVNVCWLSVLSTTLLSLVIGLMWTAYPPSSIVSEGRQLGGQFKVSVALAGVASVLESASEPLVFSLIRREEVLLRSVIEALSGTSKSLVLAFLVALGGPGLDVLYYSLGQLVYSSVLLLSTLLACLRVDSRSTEDLLLLPGALLGAGEDGSSPGPRFLLDAHKGLLRQHLLSSLQSTVLQETDKVLVLRLFSAKEWSDYGVIANLANVATRVVFAPIEEVAAERLREVRLDSLRAGPTGPRLRRQLAPLRELLFFSGFVGCLAVCFGPPVSGSLLALVFGASRATPANARLLSANIYVLGILSIHGILETFMLSLGGVDRVSAYRRFCMAVHCMHVLLVLLLRSAGCIALVLGSGAAMLLQTLYCISFLLQALGPALSGLAPWPRLRSLRELLLEKSSGRALLCLALGGAAQRGLLVYLTQTHPRPEASLLHSLRELLASSVLAACSLALSLPPLLRTLGKLHTD